MKFVDNILYIEFQEAVDAGVSTDTLKDARKSGYASWNFIDDPVDRRKVLIQYDTLKPKYQALIVEKFGNPYVYAGQKTVKSALEADHEALKTLLTYRFENGKALKDAEITALSKACDVLKHLVSIEKRPIKQLGYDSKASYYDTVIAFNKREGIKLPTNYSRLREAVRRYKIEGALSLISGKFGNNNSKKVTDPEALGFLIKALSHVNNFGDSIISVQFNQWAAERGLPTITEATVGNYRRTHEREIILHRNGIGAFRNKFDEIVSRERPSAPLLLINSDDNNLDLYFIDGTNNYFRPVLIVVTDAYNDYILGYAIGTAPSKELVRDAYIDAIRHVRELTGDYYWTHQIVTDRWGLKSQELMQFYEGQGDVKFTPPAHSNARTKPIEQSFGHVWHEALKLVSAKTFNYSGHNITAKKKINREFIDKYKKMWPQAEQAVDQVAAFIHYLRNVKSNEQDKSRQQVWLEGWNAMHPERKKLLSHENRLMTCGIARTEYTTKVTNYGIKLTVNGEEHLYQLSPEDYDQCLGLTGYVTYEPTDMNTILFVAMEGAVRVVAHAYQKFPMALADFKPGDHERLNKMLERKKQFSQKYLNRGQERAMNLLEKNIQVESIMQAGVLTKEIKNSAEREYGRLDAPKTDENISPEDWLQDKW